MFSAVKSNMLMLYKEAIATYSHSFMEHMKYRLLA
jgi:hypothetical protein